MSITDRPIGVDPGFQKGPMGSGLQLPPSEGVVMAMVWPSLCLDLPSCTMVGLNRFLGSVSLTDSFSNASREHCSQHSICDTQEFPEAGFHC